MEVGILVAGIVAVAVWFFYQGWTANEVGTEPVDRLMARRIF